MESILDLWPWYISGPLIALIMLFLLFIGKSFGVSANLRTFCTMCGAGKKYDFFKFDWKAQSWNLVFLVGTIVGGFLASHYLSPENNAADISQKTVQHLETIGFDSAGKSYLPTELFSNEAFTDGKTLLLLILGGFLVGFGARYAGGCTSGHAISGLSNLQLPSLIAVIGFFIGGLIMVHFIFPFIF
ncbi:YeeE/YedE family protein [Abyssalbus ytuae]|uniref:YeeE/YedE family protein n=1 Tax=Abyssalbus ytuae TaxID=2926907 RepID=A0A9E6ZLP5_9FLAO|nr:YeeE/YedE thiosulfate transporter family protein [Abyssalbus ytuae]UOB16470.1 YeeE/YedE family protein [Abyssalbus ytuae]